jgi:ABC-2 type transport system permease protein
MDFHRVKLVARRELVTRLRQRSYRLTMLFQVLVVVAAACLPVVFAAFRSDVPSSATVMVVDADGTNLAVQLAPYVASGDASGEAVTLAPSAGTLDDAAEAVRDGDVDAAIVAGREADGALFFTYLNEEGNADSLSQQLYAGLSAVTLEDRLSQSGIDEATFEAAIAPPGYTLQAAVNDGVGDEGGIGTVGGVEVALAYFFTILMFMAIVLYGNWVAQGVVEEKSTRIMEIMINAATPRDLLAGKVLGIGAAGLLQLLPMLLAGGTAFALQRPIARALNISTESLPDIDFGGVSLAAVGWFLVYFLLGFTLYAAMYAALGSLVSRQEEVSQAVAPLQTISMVAYIAAFITMWVPDSLASQIFSIFPLTSPFIMISRVIVGEPAGWELALSVGVLSLTTIGAIAIAGRIYRVGVLQYGQKPSLRAVFSRGLEQAAR